MEMLTDWARCLPPRDSHHHGQATAVNTSGFLHLGFHATKALLFRGIMRPFHNADQLQWPVEDQAEPRSAHAQVRLGAKSCAAAFSSFIQELDPAEFQAFWPFCKW